MTTTNIWHNFLILVTDVSLSAENIFFVMAMIKDATNWLPVIVTKVYFIL